MWRTARQLVATALVGILILAAFRAVIRARTFQLFGELVSRVDTGEPVIALTFDDGPIDGTLEGILATLAASDIRSTFFVVGDQLERSTGAGRRLVEAGHELGNHSYSHERMILTSAAAARVEVERTDALIRAAGHRGPILFRAPYGVKFVGLPWYLRKSGRTSVTWDIEPESYPDVGSNATAIVEHVLDRIRPGSIILLHPWYRTGTATRQALPGIIEGAGQRGFRFVTVSELLRLRRN